MSIEVNKENPESAATTPAAPTVEELTAERDQLAREKAELYDRLLRKQAEFENYRKRMEREKKEFRQQAYIEVLKAVLPILDDLERALKAPAGADAAGEFRKGVELLHKRFVETLHKLGLEPIETKDKKFDPHLHHAVEMVESEDHEDQAILEEFQKGYQFHHRLLRPAMVRVTVRPQQKN